MALWGRCPIRKSKNSRVHLLQRMNDEVSPAFRTLADRCENDKQGEPFFSASLNPAFFVVLAQPS